MKHFLQMNPLDQLLIYLDQDLIDILINNKP